MGDGVKARVADVLRRAGVTSNTADETADAILAVVEADLVRQENDRLRDRLELTRAQARLRKRKSRSVTLGHVTSREVTGRPGMSRDRDISGSGSGSSSGSGSGSDPDPSKPTLEGHKEMSAPAVELAGKRVRLAMPDPFSRMLRKFCEVWGERYGVSYQPTPKDRNQLGRLISKMPPQLLETLPEAFGAYLRDESHFVADEQRHNLAWFCTSGGVNKYRATPSQMTEKEAATHAAGDLWLSMHNGHGNAGKR